MVSNRDSRSQADATAMGCRTVATRPAQASSQHGFDRRGLISQIAASLAFAAVAGTLITVAGHGAWPLARLAQRDDELGTLSSEFAGAIDELALVVADFSSGAAKSSVSIKVVSDKVEKTPLTGKVCDRIFNECVRRGLLTMAYSPRFRIQPPLTTDEATAMNGLAILKEVFDLVERETWWR